MIRKILFAGILALALGCMKANAQYAVTIYNNSELTIGFNLSFDGINYATYYLAPFYFNTYQLYYSPNCFISLKTNNGITVNYQLLSPNRYQIYWNMNHWDVSQY
jgi:hypothetical protein